MSNIFQEIPLIMNTVKYEQMEPDLRRAEGKSFDERREKRVADNRMEQIISQFSPGGTLQGGLNGQRAVDWYLRKTASGYKTKHLPVSSY